MKYKNTIPAVFISRPNRFIAIVDINGKEETVHVKNTGRCRELLIPGCRVILEDSQNPKRKTRYDLISTYKEGLGWVNIDSQAPNKLVKEWLEKGPELFNDIEFIKSEYTYKNSRVDFYMESKRRRILMEVKGCTLEIDGMGYFPDAPTQRGVKHLRELTAAVSEGYECYIAFVIAMPGIKRVLPNNDTHPEFGEALKEAAASGVNILYLSCDVDTDALTIIECIKA